jgi:hypothetical protein
VLFLSNAVQLLAIEREISRGRGSINGPLHLLTGHAPPQLATHLYNRLHISVIAK